jgi:hypothetical protein
MISIKSIQPETKGYQVELQIDPHNTKSVWCPNIQTLRLWLIETNQQEQYNQYITEYKQNNNYTQITLFTI